MSRMSELKWSKAEKAIGKRAFDMAYRRECEAIIKKLREMVASAAEPEDLSLASASNMERNPAFSKGCERRDFSVGRRKCHRLGPGGLMVGTYLKLCDLQSR